MQKKSLIGAVAFFALMFLSVSARAEGRYESQVIYKKGAWEVEITHDTFDGQLWCSASTTNKQEQSLDITAFDDGILTLYVFDHDWIISPRKLRFIIDIDYERWFLNGEGDDIAVSMDFTDKEKSIRFLSELMDGRTVAVLNSTEQHLASFTLSGSYAAIINLFECWKKIGSNSGLGSRDPFAASSDPF